VKSKWLSVYDADPLGLKLQFFSLSDTNGERETQTYVYEGVGVGIIVKFVVTLSLSSCLSHLNIFIYIYSYAHAVQIEKRKLKTLRIDWERERSIFQYLLSLSLCRSIFDLGLFYSVRNPAECCLIPSWELLNWGAPDSVSSSHSVSFQVGGLWSSFWLHCSGISSGVVTNWVIHLLRRQRLLFWGEYLMQYSKMLVCFLK